MNARARTLVEAALDLPRKTRVELVRELLESLEEVVDPAAEKLWAKEIERRAKEVVRGRGKGPTVEEAFRMALSEMKK